MVYILSTVDKSDNSTACPEEELCIKILNIDNLKLNVFENKIIHNTSVRQHANKQNSVIIASYMLYFICSKTRVEDEESETENGGCYRPRCAC